MTPMGVWALGTFALPLKGHGKGVNETRIKKFRLQPKITETESRHRGFCSVSRI